MEEMAKRNVVSKSSDSIKIQSYKMVNKKKRRKIFVLFLLHKSLNCMGSCDENLAIY